MKTTTLKYLYFTILICTLVTNTITISLVHAAQTIPGVQRLEEGIVAYEHGEYDEAIFKLEMAIYQIEAEDKDKLWDAHFYLGLSYYLTGDNDETKKEFIKASGIIKSRIPVPDIHSPKIVKLFKDVQFQINYVANIDMKEIFCIIPIGYIDNKTLQYTQMELEKKFNVVVDIGRQLEDPIYAYHKYKKQYNSTKILKKIHNLRLRGYDRILVIVDVDLYIPELTYLFGAALDEKKKVSIISLTRLRQGFYGLPEDIDLYNKRVITEAVHVLGYTYGLHKCKSSDCVMSSASTVDDLDRRGAMFCNECKNKLVKIGHR
jgi:archaemetzincin